jgi:hypothetical protein
MGNLNCRKWTIVSGPGSSEAGCVRENVVVPVDRAQSALVVIDPWASHPNEGFSARLAANIPNLVALINRFRVWGRPIYYDSTGFPIHPSVLANWGPYDHLIAWDPIGGGTQVLNNALNAGGIRNIFWGGYSTNLCLMMKPCGFRKMMPMDWTRKHFIVRDCTIAFESGETLPTQGLWDQSIYEVEYYSHAGIGYSTTLQDVEGWV